jgi:hypothetical protein
MKKKLPKQLKFRDGSIKITFKKGEIVRVSTNAQLDEIYQRIFYNARRNLLRRPVQVRIGIQVIIFGCFWLEAYSNEVLRFLLNVISVTNNNVSKEYSSVLWGLLKRQNLVEKLLLFRSLSDESHSKVYPDLLKKLKVVLDLRNRLAHFKSEEELIPVPEKKNIKEWFLEIPDPNIMGELKGNRVIQHSSVILETHKWIKDIHNLNRRHIGLSLERKVKPPNK